MKKWEVGYTSSGEFHIKPRPETPLQRSKYARLIETACNAAQEINPSNQIAAAEAMPEIWQLLNAALPIIEAEADRRDDVGQYASAVEGSYWREMRELADRIEALIRKATARE